jgi:hypothetical protein
VWWWKKLKSANENVNIVHNSFSSSFFQINAGVSRNQNKIFLEKVCIRENDFLAQNSSKIWLGWEQILCRKIKSREKFVQEGSFSWHFYCAEYLSETFFS